MYFSIKSFFVLNVLSLCYGARILGVFFYPSYSHQIVFHAITSELSQRGHEVIAITPNPVRDPSLINLTEIDMSHIYEKYYQSWLEKLEIGGSYSQIVAICREYLSKIAEDIFDNDDFKKMYQNGETFDLVLVEAVTSMVPVYGYLFKAPTIGVSSMEAEIDKFTDLGGIIHPSIYGGNLIDFEYPIKIWHKIRNTYNFLWNKYFIKFIHEPTINQINKKYLGKDFPSIDELNETMSMLFVTKNPLMASVRPTPPNILLLDFMHVKEPKTLPKSLEQILNNSSQGVVYFSLGSNVKSASLPPPIRNAIIQGLSSLPYTVLWKWESDEVPGVRENVITRKWFPQQDVLAHPNIKVFVTQGGLQSIDEAISRAVPLIGIPVIGDQEDNVKKLVKLRIAVQLSLNELTSNSLKSAIIEVAENKKYSKRIKELRDVALDQPMTGIERAVWWSEYVIRNKGAPALRSVLADVPLYEYLMLDVIAVVLLVLVVSILVFRKLVVSAVSILPLLCRKRKLE